MNKGISSALAILIMTGITIILVLSLWYFMPKNLKTEEKWQPVDWQPVDCKNETKKEKAISYQVTTMSYIPNESIERELKQIEKIGRPIDYNSLRCILNNNITHPSEYTTIYENGTFYKKLERESFIESVWYCGFDFNVTSQVCKEGKNCRNITDCRFNICNPPALSEMCCPNKTLFCDECRDMSGKKVDCV